MSTTRQIIVVKLGWVLVGRVVAESPSSLTITHAHVVRVWGTTKGLGELAEKGPLKQTILEPTGHVVIQLDAVLFRIDCEDKSWTKIIP
jgi:hypothetical protein